MTLHKEISDLTYRFDDFLRRFEIVWSDLAITRNCNRLLTKRVFFFNSCLAAPWPTLGHYQGGSLTHQMLITCVLYIRPEGHWEPCNKVGSLSPAKHLVGFELGTFRFWSQCLKQLGHSPLERNVVSVGKECSY